MIVHGSEHAGRDQAVAPMECNGPVPDVMKVVLGQVRSGMDQGSAYRLVYFLIV